MEQTNEPQISMTAQASQREQIEDVLKRVREKQQPLRLRLPLHFYDLETRGYTALRDGSWNFTLPGASTPEHIERLIYTIGKCLTALAQDGMEETLRKLGVAEP